MSTTTPTRFTSDRERMNYAAGLRMIADKIAQPRIEQRAEALAEIICGKFIKKLATARRIATTPAKPSVPARVPSAPVKTFKVMRRIYTGPLWG